MNVETERELVWSMINGLDRRGALRPLALAALAALGRYGDGRAVQAVRTAAAHGATGPIRLAAAALPPILEERARQERDAETLLRPAGPADTMLRAAGASAREESARLLRAAEADEA